MIVYVETSCILRRLLGEPKSLNNWGEWKYPFTSQMTRIESLRTLDRSRIIGRISDKIFTERIRGADEILGEIDEILLSPLILKRAAQPYPTPIGTLDAIHLASALFWQERNQEELIFLTHDIQLGRAALAMGLKVQGFENNPFSQ